MNMGIFSIAALDSKTERAQFNGYRRSDGRVGTRNSIGIFITVNCSATVARKIASHFTKERLSNFKNVDNVVAFVHEQGCGMELSGEPMALLRRTLAGYVNHPNIAGALVISLGCERNNLAAFLKSRSLWQVKLSGQSRCKKLVAPPPLSRKEFLRLKSY